MLRKYISKSKCHYTKQALQEELINWNKKISYSNSITIFNQKI